MNAFTEKVYAFTQENHLFSLPCTLIVGVSGGADSMSLLHVLSHWPEPGLRLFVVHVDHGLRGEDAKRDAVFVAEYCKKAGIPCELVPADVAAVAKNEKIGTEEAGRRVRYEAFVRVAERENAAAIAVAHTADDRAETVLLHMARGCGIEGLVGMMPRRDQIVRPLLCCTRAEVENYCTAEGIEYVNDATNAEEVYARNRVRHQVLPSLRSVNPSADAAILRLADSAAQDSAYLMNIAVNRLDDASLPGGYDLSAFAVEPPIRRRMVRELLARADCRSAEEVHFSMMDDALFAGHGGVSLPGGWHFIVNDGVVSLERDRAVPDIPDARTVIWTENAFSFSVNGTDCRLLLCDRPEWEKCVNVHKMFFKYSIDYDKIQGGLQIRGRQTGDEICLAGRHLSKSLKKLMTEEHIPVEFRNSYPVLSDGDGVVLVPGIGCDERVAPDMRTKRFLLWFVDGELCHSIRQILDHCVGLFPKE